MNSTVNFDIKELTRLDYGIFLSILGMSFAIGIFNAFKGEKTDKDYFVAQRSFGFMPVALSLLTTFISAIAILGMTGEGYTDGIQFVVTFFGSIFGIIFAAIFIAPVFYNLEIVSIFEYVEKRFQSKFLEKYLMFLTVIRKFVYMGLALYAPTLVLATVTRLNPTTYIYMLGLICTLYASFGGMRAVIWTDVFQFCIILLGLVSTMGIVFYEVGGVQRFWSIATEGGRLSVFNLDIKSYDRMNFFSCLIMGFFNGIVGYGFSQEVVQRWCSVKSLKDAKRVLYVCAIGNIIAYSSLLLCGAALYAYYSECDPLTLKIISKKDQILPFFIMQKGSFIYGFPGLFVGVIFAATLSTLSSVLNATTAIIWKDVLQKFPFFKNISSAKARITNVILSLIIGIIMVVLAHIFSKAGGLNRLAYSINGAMNGPIGGPFLLGLFVSRSRSRGAIAAILGSSVFITWIAIGSATCSAASSNGLPLSTEKCGNLTLIQENVDQNQTVQHGLSGH